SASIIQYLTVVLACPALLGGGGLPCVSACAGLMAELGTGFIRELARAIHASERPQKIICDVVPRAEVQRVDLSVFAFRLVCPEILLRDDELPDADERRVLLMPL